MAMNNGFCRTAWLLIAHRGGWWTPQAVKAAVPPELVQSDVSVLLWAMANRDEVLERRGPRNKPEYAVTQGCYVPRCVRVEQVPSRLLGEVQ